MYLYDVVHLLTIFLGLHVFFWTTAGAEQLSPGHSFDVAREHVPGDHGSLQTWNVTWHGRGRGHWWVANLWDEWFLWDLKEFPRKLKRVMELSWDLDLDGKVCLVILWLEQFRTRVRGIITCYNIPTYRCGGTTLYRVNPEVCRKWWFFGKPPVKVYESVLMNPGIS